MLSASAVAEPFVDDKLISIVLCMYVVELHFEPGVMQIGGHFSLSRPGHADGQFEPGKQLGAVHSLWPLIGRSVSSAHWGTDCRDTVDLIFENIAVVRILPVDKDFRGMIRGKFPPPGTLQIEDF